MYKSSPTVLCPPHDFRCFRNNVRVIINRSHTMTAKTSHDLCIEPCPSPHSGVQPVFVCKKRLPSLGGKCQLPNISAYQRTIRHDDHLSLVQEW